VDVVRKGYSVIKRIGLLMMTALIAAMMLVATAAPAFASPESDCESQGEGFMYTNNQGTKTCTGPGTPNDKFSCTDSQKGNVGISGTSNTLEEGNKNKNNNDTNSAHCK
jgi:hypothetical protein